ncbi:MAG: GNAT family N-acetyltransferase [Candidatus Kapaibacterium sp.]
MILRKYTNNDFEECVQLFQQVYGETYPDFEPHYHEKQRFYDIMTNHVLPQNELFVVSNNEIIIAFIAIHNNCLDQLYVTHSFQGKGVGSMLVNKAKEINPECMELFTFTQNNKAITFYEKHGFRIIKHGIAPDEKKPDVLMRWEKSNS